MGVARGRLLLGGRWPWFRGRDWFTGFGEWHVMGSANGFVGVSADGHGFVTGAADGNGDRRFLPIGCNYFDPATGWAPKIWSQFDAERVAQQLKQIGDTGFTTVRVFLDASTLNPAPGVYSDEGFAKVERMVALAAAAGLRIIFSGPNGWEGRARHAWGDMYGDEAVLDMRCALWRQIMARLGDEPTVMAWDLHNEPSVGWPRAEHAANPRFGARLNPRRQAWRAFAGERLGEDPGEHFPAVDPAGQSPEVYACYVRFQECLAERWVRRQCEAIRGGGARQLITFGMHQSSIPIHLPGQYAYGGFNPRRVGRYLDYMSVHFYPMLPDVDVGMVEPYFTQRKGYVEIVARSAHVAGKPLVIEEFGWKGGTRVPRETKTWPEEHQTMWSETLVRVTSRVASGWLNWGYADSPDPATDISGASGLWTSDTTRLKHWGQRFRELAREFAASAPTYQPAGTRFDIDLLNFLVAHDGRPDNGWLAEHCGEVYGDGVEVVWTRPWDADGVD